MSNEGNRPYHPAMMVKILFYAYTKGIFSSRKIAEALKHNNRWLFAAMGLTVHMNQLSAFKEKRSTWKIKTEVLG